MADPLSPAERAFRELQSNPVRYAEWAEQMRHEWALRGLERTRPKGAAGPHQPGPGIAPPAAPAAAPADQWAR